MRTKPNIICCGVALALALATCDSLVASTDPVGAAQEITVLPRQHQWTLVDPAARPALAATARLSAAARDRLLSSDSARERGIGIFVADQQGDVACLLSLSALLEDEAATVPYALPVAHAGGYAQGEQTVAEYLNAAYREWLGVEVDKSRRRFDRLLGEVDEPDHLVRPWIVRLQRVRKDVEGTAELKQRVRALPEAVIPCGLLVDRRFSFFGPDAGLSFFLNFSIKLTNPFVSQTMIVGWAPHLNAQWYF